MMKHTVFLVLSGVFALFSLSGCTTNPATGNRQFTALMSPDQEVQVGAQEHQNVLGQYGLYEGDPALASYVSQIGDRVTARTERPDVEYRFYVIDSPIVNAFALPSGYIYVSRGLLALANNEAQLAAVLSHEAGHITGRHSAERYSRGVVASLGAGVLGAVIGQQGVSEALGTGANLYLSSYSRTQENEADTLGLRYMTQGGYAPDQMAAFLSNLQARTGLDARLAGQNGASAAASNYFSTHPATQARVLKTINEADAYGVHGDVLNRDVYLRSIEGVLYGDSPSQGFTRGQRFYHPEIGFSFDAPDGYRLINQPNQVIAVKGNGQDGAPLIVFDMVSRGQGQGAKGYLQHSWLKERENLRVDTITVNGMAGATTLIDGVVNGAAVDIRAIVIEFSSSQFVRFQIVMPKTIAASEVEDLKRASYSFKRLSAKEKRDLRPHRVRLITAKSGDTIKGLARQMPYDDYAVERFRVLNGLLPNEALVVGRRYKVIGE